MPNTYYFNNSTKNFTIYANLLEGPSGKGDINISSTGGFVNLQDNLKIRSGDIIFEKGAILSNELDTTHKNINIPITFNNFKFCDPKIMITSLTNNRNVWYDLSGANLDGKLTANDGINLDGSLNISNNLNISNGITINNNNLINCNEITINSLNISNGIIDGLLTVNNGINAKGIFKINSDLSFNAGNLTISGGHLITNSLKANSNLKINNNKILNCSEIQGSEIIILEK